MRALPTGLALAIAALLFSSGPVAGSCAAIESVEEAIRTSDVAFVGTVVRLSNDGRWATVRVEEVWHGPDLAPVVEVRGGPGGNVASSVDRTFAMTRYLFAASISGGTLHDNSCTATTEWSEDLARFRPNSARVPLDAPGASEPAAPTPALPLVAVLGGIGVAVVMLFSAALLAARRRGASS